MENEADTWFYDSIIRYKNLNMFEMQYPVHSIELTSNNSFCVSCYDSKCNQLLELALPLKLTSQLNSSACGSLTSGTDLKIKCGTFTPSMIHHFKEMKSQALLETFNNYMNEEIKMVLPSQKAGKAASLDISRMRTCINDRMVVASSYNNKGVDFYQLSTDDSDDIKNTLSAKVELETPYLALSDTLLVLAQHTHKPVFVMDIKTGKTINNINKLFDSGSIQEQVSPAYVDSKVVALCKHTTGTMQLYDIRDSKVIPNNMDRGKKNRAWEFTTFYESSTILANSIQSTSIAMISNQGFLKVFDSRNWNLPYFTASLDIQSSNSSFKIRFSPSNEHLISVSGFDGNVYVYKLKKNKLQQLFVHDGHKHVEGFSSNTTTSDHQWVPNIDNLIISSACNGTIQTWQFKDS